MRNEEKTYSVLSTLFAVLIVTGNLIYQKFVYLPIKSIYTFELSVGAIIYPLTFLLTDLVAEFYGKEKARFCVKLGIAMNITVMLIVMLANQLEATNWSKISDEQFNKVFGFYGVAFIGSIIANYIAQSIDILLYLSIRKITGNRLLWLRNNLSTAISLLIDTFIVVSFLTLFKILPQEQYITLMFNSYVFKLFFTICSTPIFYIGVSVIKKFNYT